jgi:uncharacterized protein (TIGR03435 family)
MERRLGFRGNALLVAGVMTFSSLVSGSPSSGTAAQQTQGTASSLAFEVASIKPSEGDGHMVRIQTSPGGRYTASGVTLKMLIQQAYDVKDFQITGGPAWMSTMAFDIVAKAENPDVNRDQIRQMLQSLLAGRFQLKFHLETRELPVYALVVGKSGHKLQLSANQPEKEATPPDATKGNSHVAGGAGGTAKPVGAMMSMGRGQLNAQMVPISAFINMLAQQLGRPVIDKTDLKGNYDLKLEWTPDESHRVIGGGGGVEAAPTGDSSGPSIFTAVQEQLGLKLESQKGPVELLVIDSAEKPSGN